MKYDPEYNSYRFSDCDMSVILKSLDFYNQYSPLLEQGERDYINHLINDLEKTKGVNL